MIANERGSLTIEAAMVFTLVVFSAALLLFAFMLIYNKAVLTSMAIDLAKRTGEVILREEGMYSSFNIQEQKVLHEEIEGVEELKAKLLWLQNNSEFQGDNRAVSFNEIRADLYESMLKKLIKLQQINIFVDAKKVLSGIEIRVGLTMKVRGCNGFVLSGSGMTTMIKPTDYIRKMDLGLEYFQRLKEGVIE